MKALPRKAVAGRFRPRGRNWPLIFAFMIACGGATKTTTATSLAVVLALRGYRLIIFDLDANLSTSKILGYDEEALEGRKTAYDLLAGKATLEEVLVPARYRISDGEGDTEEERYNNRYKDECFQVIPNLLLVPGSPDLAQADTLIAVEDRGDWFVDLMHGYEGDEELILVDFPASYGKMVYSVARMLDEEDSIIPSVRADPKDVEMLPALFKELTAIKEKNAGKRYVPGRPTVNHLVLTGTNTPSYTEAAPRRATQTAEDLYGERLLPYVRYSADAKKIYEDKCPIELLLPNSYPAEDYRKIATAMKFPDRRAS